MIQELVISSFFNYDRKREFNSEANIVASAYAQRLRSKSFSADQFETIEVVLVDKIIGKEKIVSDWLLRKQTLFDFDNYWSLLIDDRKSLLLNILRDELLIFSELNKWDKDAVLASYDETIKDGIRREAYWANTVELAGNRKANVYYLLGRDAVEFYIVIADKSGSVVKRKKIFNTWPNDAYVFKTLGDLIREKDKIKLVSEDKAFEITYDLNNENIDIHGKIPKWVIL